MNILQRRKFAQARTEYSPRKMMQHLQKATDGTVYFNRLECVKTEDDISKFYYVLNRDYLSGYKDIEKLTVFFDIEGDVIIGGAYNIQTGERTSKIRLISENTTTLYTYTNEDIEKLKNILNNT